MLSAHTARFTAAIATLAALLLAACEDEPRTRAGDDCAAPPGTSPFVFESGGRELFGFVDAPGYAGRHPAVLIVPGSGPTDVTSGNGAFEVLRAAFREAGIASVVWDKAGSGCSGGRYNGLADLYRRADDVVAAAAALGGREDIDAERIGAWAIGEGGWVAPMAVTRADLLKFLILVGPPASDPIERISHLAQRHLRSEGYAEAQAESLARQLADALAMMRNQAAYREYRAAIASLSEHPLLPPISDVGGDVYASEERYDELRESAALHVTVDVFLAALDVPVLVVWGDEDNEVDWRKGMRVYREAFEKAANEDASIQVLEGADHEICAARPDGEMCRLAEGYLELMTGWLVDRGFTGPSGERQSRNSTTP